MHDADAPVLSFVLTRKWQVIAPGIEARVLSWGDQRVDPDGRPIDGSSWIPEEVQRTQRFVPGAKIEVRHA